MTFRLEFKQLGFKAFDQFAIRFGVFHSVRYGGSDGVA
jgi:hypothetical protein